MKAINLKRLAAGCLLAVSLVLTLGMPVLALPQIPHQFWGQVTIDGLPAGEGAVVSAQIEGVEYASTTTDALGRYGYDPLFRVSADDPETPEKEGGTDGEMIEFYVGGVLATTNAFQIAGRDELDLAVVGAVSLAADAGTYTGYEGAAIALSGSASGGTGPYTYEWDLDDDGEYDDATGATPSHSWEVAGIYTIGLRVTDDVADTATDTTTVTVLVEGAFDPLDYDTDEDGVLSKDETVAAVEDYQAGGIITEADALAVVQLYFS